MPSAVKKIMSWRVHGARGRAVRDIGWKKAQPYFDWCGETPGKDKDET